MEIKKQILLPKKSFALADDSDVFISLQLNKTFSDIKTERINNVFNINQQYDIERQSSLKFCIFGLVESLYANTENIIVDVEESTNLTLNLPKISSDNIAGKTLSIKTFELTMGSNGMSRNLYGKTKSAYSILFEIDKNELKFQDEQIRSNGGIPKTRTVDFTIVDVVKNIFFVKKVPYLFYDLDGNPVKFGSQTADVDEEGNITEIDNDFPFFYDRHWIKQYFNLPAPSFVFFPDKNIDIIVSTGLPTRNINLNIAIDQPSPLGLEEATIILISNNTISVTSGKGDGNNIIINQNPNFNFVTQTIKWNIGEQYKTFNLKIIDGILFNNKEVLTFEIVDFKYSIPKSNIDMKMDVNIIGTAFH